MLPFSVQYHLHVRCFYYFLLYPFYLTSMHVLESVNPLTSPVRKSTSTLNSAYGSLVQWHQPVSDAGKKTCIVHTHCRSR